MFRKTVIIAAIAICVLAALAIATPSSDARPTTTWSKASCYGPGLYGNHMANGQVLLPSTLGVAHRTLRLGTRVRVYSGRRSWMTTVKDRGPFSGDRKWDLTEGLVRKLGVSGCRSWGVRVTKVTVVQ